MSKANKRHQRKTSIRATQQRDNARKQRPAATTKPPAATPVPTAAPADVEVEVEPNRLEAPAAVGDPGASEDVGAPEDLALPDDLAVPEESGADARAFESYQAARERYEDLTTRTIKLKSELKQLRTGAVAQKAQLDKHVLAAREYAAKLAGRDVETLEAINDAMSSLERRQAELDKRARALDALEGEVRGALERLVQIQDDEIGARIAAIGAELEQQASLSERLRAGLQEAEERWAADYEARWKRLDDQLAQRRAQEQADVAALRATTESELAALREQAEAELAASREELATAHGDVTRDRAALHLEQKQHERASEALHEQVERLAELRVVEAQKVADLAERKARALEEIVDERAEELARLEGIERRIGGLKDHQIVELQEKYRLLLAESEQQLGADERLRIDRLEAENAALAQANHDLLEQATELTRRDAEHRSADQTLEQLRREIAELDTQKAAIAHRCEEMRLLLASLTDEEARDRVFPNLFHYDETLSTPRRDLIDPPPLRELARELQQRLRHPPDGGPPLLYTLDEVRLFLAGMAMSRLHILEGPAGTGKTTLPRAMARALGGTSRVIEIEAGWRDSLDLYGHYSSFERLFDERDFTKAVYEAGCDRHRDEVFLVVLDEMNLSRPEQYMSKILSSLEAERTLRGGLETFSLSLHNRALCDPEPELLVNSVLTATPNVWLVGTANNDETTETFAPKTYDRSFVMPVQRRTTVTDPGPPPGDSGFSCERLAARFDQAEKAGAPEVERVRGLLAEPTLLAALEPIGETPSWRFERQLRRLAGVLIATDGTIGEALDHLLATRSLHDTPGRFGVTHPMLEEAQLELTAVWEAYEVGGQPSKTLDVLAKAHERVARER